MLEVIITVHDQQIVLDFEQHGKYRALPSYTYAFVGARDCEKIRHLPNVVIARELPENIEQHPNLIDFTAWYAFIRNGLIRSEFVALLQYDTAIAQDFHQQTLARLTREPASMLGYEKWPILDANFIRDTAGRAPLADALHAVYGVDLDQVVSAYVDTHGDTGWPATDNLAMSAKLLADYVDWFEPMAKRLAPSPYAGHAFERSFKIFCILKEVENIYAPRLAHHYQLNSHGTQGFSVDFEKELSRVAGNELPKTLSLSALKARLLHLMRKRWR